MIGGNVMEHPEKSYRFAALADIHIDWENDGKNIYFIPAEKNFSRALAYRSRC